MVSILDEYSTYIPPEKLHAFQSRMLGMERGLGLRVAIAEGAVRVIGSLINSPAREVGIVPGDTILTVDGNRIAEMPLREVEEILKGELGTSVVLAVERLDGSRRTFTLTRSEFPLESVEGLYRDFRGQWVYFVDSDRALAYVRIREFVNDTGGQLKKTLQQLVDLRGLVLDLRDNPGGTCPLRWKRRICSSARV